MTGAAEHRCFLPPRARLNNTMRSPQVLCMISEHLWFTFFNKVSLPVNCTQAFRGPGKCHPLTAVPPAPIAFHMA